MKQESLVEKVIYRLIRKHISGPTMGSAIARAKQFNGKGIPVSISFMSQPPKDRAKANYITTTYLQLIREISRMGIKANVHLKFEQLGQRVSDDFAIENLSQILETAKKWGVFVWCEISDPIREPILLNRLHGAQGLGVALNSIEDAISYAKRNKGIKELKVNCRGHTEDAKEKHDSTAASLEALAASAKSLVLHSPKEAYVSRLMKKNPKYRKSLIFEFQLGYGEKKLNKMLKKGTRLSVYIPFGKDWASYAMTNVPEGYTRALANRLLTEGGEGV
ncbi:MAG: hypothetical protein ACREBF_03405 [Candidatus Micrarchaeales archaeon]